MPKTSQNQVTRLLAEVGEGRPSAADQLLPMVYDELRALASNFFRRQRPDHTLQPTALVHEAYAKMVEYAGRAPEAAQWQDRAHFFAVAAKAMRQILSNHAREHRAAKRGGDWKRITLSQAIEPSGNTDIDLLALHQALEKLTELDERQCKVVELRFFADMTVQEISHVLGVSPSTVEREWRMARAWLSSELRRDDPDIK